MPFLRRTFALVALALLLVGATKASAGFAPVASSITGRAHSTSTLLPSGRVLVVGGEDANGALLNSTELYDPASNKWTGAAPLISAREHHTATLLPSGKVLVAGGIGVNATMLANAEIYDPVTNGWSLAGTLSVGRAYHTMTQLPSGKVLVVGGQTTGSPSSLSSAELYDPATNSWSPAAPAIYPRKAHAAALLPSGKVMVMGGYTDYFPMGGSPYEGAVEVYDPASNTWTDRAPLLTARQFHTATVLASGIVLVAGGYGAAGVLAAVETYDPASNTWSSIPSLGTARGAATATLLPSGKVLVVGGLGAAGALSPGELYDPALSAWSGVSNPLPGRFGHTATLLSSGQVLVATGAVTGGVVALAERYDDGGDAWAPTNALNSARYAQTVTQLVSGKVLIAGGSNNANVPSAGAELYDSTTSSFTVVSSLFTARSGQTATLLLSGKVLVVGGKDANGNYLASAELFNPFSNSWQQAAPLNTPRSLHTATLLPSGQVLVVAGFNPSGRLKSAEVYDPVTDSWVQVGSLSKARTYHSATLLRSGKVLVAGGTDGAAASDVDLYDPASQTWQPTGLLVTPRFAHTATLLHSGKVLVAGGNDNGAFPPTGELYDPATGTWNATGSLIAPREFQAATLLASGEVLISGGYDSSFTPLAFAERYDPTTNTWLVAGSMATARVYHGATLLPTGKVLIEGGIGAGNNVLFSAELYDPGLGFLNNRRPVITATNNPTPLGTPLILTGTNFTGDSEAAGGNSDQASATNYPLVQMRRLDNDQVFWTAPDSSSTTWNGSYQSRALNGLPFGQYVVTAFVNAIPSLPKMLLLTGPASKIVVKHGSPQSAPVNTMFLAMQAQVLDSANDPVWGTTVTFAPPANGASASCTPQSAATDAAGVAQTICTANGILGSYSVSASAAGVGMPALFALTNVTGPAAVITTSAGSPQSTVVNTPFAQALKAKVMDSGNNPVTGAVVTFAVPGSGASAGCVPSNPVLTDANGLATVTCTANTTAGSYAVNASTNGMTPAVFNLTNLPGAAATIAITSGGGQSTPVNTAFSGPLMVSVVDSFNNGVGSVPITFVVPPNGASAVCPAAITDANGKAPTTCVANATMGSYTVKASTGALNSSAVSLTNLAGAAATISYTTPPSNAVAGANIAPPIVVHVADANGNPVGSDGITLTLVVNPGGSTLMGGTATTNASGDATFAGVSLNHVGTGYTLKATDSSANPLTATSGSFNISAAAAATISYTTPPSNAVAGANITPPIVVHAQDANGNPVAGDSITLTLAANPGGSTLIGGGATTNASGDATFAGVSLNHVGAGYTLKATDSSASPLTATSGPFNIGAGVAATITVQAGSPQSTMVGTLFGADLQAKVTDALNNPVPGASVLFTGPPSGASGTCAPIGVITGANGIATSTCTANAIAGSYTLSASTSGVPTPAAFSLTNLSGVAASITVHTGSPQSTVVNTAFAQPLKAKVIDSGNNPVAGAAVTFTVPGSGASVSCLPSNPVLTDANGLGTVTCTANTTAGGYEVDASTNGLAPAAFGLTNLAGAAAAIMFTSGGGQSTPVNTTFPQPLAVSVVDGFNNGIGNVPVTFVVPPNGTSAVCPAAATDASGHAETTCTANATIGSYTVKASTGALSSSAVSLTNLAGAAAAITVQAGSPQSTAVNTAFAQPLKAKVVDSVNNPVTGASVTFTTPAGGASAACAPSNPVLTDAAGIATVTCAANTIAGSYAVQASTSALPSAQFGLTNVPGAATAIAITSGGGQSTPVNTVFAQPLAVSVIDGFNNGIGNVPLTFVVPPNGASAECPAATTDASGHAQTTCTANAISGSYTVKVSTGALTSAAVSLTNLAAAASSISYTTGPSNAVAGSNIAPPIVVHVQDANGNPVAGDGVTFTLATNPGGSTLMGGGTVATNASGDATFAAVSLDRAGTGYTLKASDSGANPLMVTSAPFNISAGAAAAITVQAGSPQSTMVGTTFSTGLQAKVTDALGNPLSGASVLFTGPPSGASAACSPVNATTDSDGIAQTTCTANDIVGTYVMNASYESLTAAFDLSNFGPLAVVCTLPTQIGFVGDSVNIDLVPLFNAPGQTLTYDAIGLPPSLTVDTVNGLIDGVLDQNDVPGSAYAVTLRATGDAGSADEHVRFEVLDPRDVVFRYGFEDSANQQVCQ
jgi:N-acetylneuraminic acid mutarotase